MSPKDARNLEKLQARLSASRTAVRIARENLIEALGDHMCGSGSGPTPKDLRALALASRREARVLLELAKVATASVLVDHMHEAHDSTGPPQHDRPDEHPHKR